MCTYVYIYVAKAEKQCTYMYMNNDYRDKLKQSRERAGLTQKEVESELRLRSLSMRDYEMGRLKLPVHVAIDLARLYQVTMDELLGVERKGSNPIKRKSLINFRSLFLGNGFGVMFLDPVLRAFLEDRQERYLDHSLFELMTESFSEKEKKELVNEIGRILFSLASTDGKISNDEVECIRVLLDAFGLANKYREIVSESNSLYLSESSPRAMERIEIRHFTIWVLFFFAYSDHNVCYEEVEYIEKIAERLRVNKSNFLFIKEKFVAEEV